MSEYRWGCASGGAVADGAPERGHGWEWRDADDGELERSPLWVARSLPDGDGGVRLGYLRRGDGAYVGEEHQARQVEQYEVLIDEGSWGWAEPVDPDADDVYLDVAGASALVCGRLADGTALYATLRDREGEGEQPGESRARMPGTFGRKVLLAPAEAPVGADAATGAAADSAAGDIGAASQSAAELAAGPVAVVSALDQGRGRGDHQLRRCAAGPRGLEAARRGDG